MDAGTSTASESNKRTEWIALLGRRDVPVDGVEDYCDFLGQALARHSVELKKHRVVWAEGGWIRALRDLWRNGEDWRDRWVLLQYTAFAWSRLGIPFGVLGVQWILRRRGAPCVAVFHEPSGQPGRGRLGKLREKCQGWIVRALYRGSAKAVFTIPLNGVRWLSRGMDKAAYIPIGANIPVVARTSASNGTSNEAVKTVAVFCMTPGPNREIEAADMAEAIRVARHEGIPLRLVVLGRGTSEMQERIEQSLAGSGTEVSVLGTVSAPEVARTLLSADAQLFVSGYVSQRRGSALAGIACGLPLVGYEGETAGTEIEEAGLSLVPYRDAAALGAALVEVLSNGQLRGDLERRSRQVQSRFFSWDAIAHRYVKALGSEQPA